MVPFLLRRFLKPVPPAVATLASSQLLRASAQATYQPHTPMIGQLHCLATFHNRPSLAARAAEFPDVIRQWHPYKNIVGPHDVTPFSNKKFWFKCDEGHEWEATLSNRCSKGYGCPICNTFKVTSTKNLLLKYPAVAAEWHLTKNGNLTPENVTSGSSKKVWWQCKEGHEWEARPHHRTTNNSGCRLCSIKRRTGVLSGVQSLLAAHPELAQQWHPTKNGALTPGDVSRAARKKVWWQCPADPSHEWEARVSSRLTTRYGCPFCKKAARPLSETNNLLALYPEVAQEWHPTLNGELTPDKIASKSGKKVWWGCE
eukprot:Colp12_sorted_trinity150504_noHs@25313